MGESRIPSLGGPIAIVGAIGAALALGGVVLDRTGVGHVFPGRAPASPSIAAADFDISLTTPAEAQPARKLPIVLAGDPTPLIPPSMTSAAPLTPDAPLSAASPPAAMPAQPARKMPVAAKREPLAHGAQGRPLIPPAVVATPLSPLSPPPLPRPPLPIETDLIPLGASPLAATPAKPPAS
jgi:hypothetical protein